MLNTKWYKNIKKELTNLPGESAHVEMIPYRLPSSAYNYSKSNVKLSAVLCLLFQKDSDTYCILMERSDDGGKHSGQISFPGGKYELTDKNLEKTALRETYEEIGIQEDSVEIIGKLTEVYIPISNFLIQPYVGIIDSNFKLKISPKEVKSAFFFNVADLLDDKTKVLKTIKNHKGIGMKNIPCFILNKKTAWGATSLMLNELKIILNRNK